MLNGFRVNHISNSLILVPCFHNACPFAAQALRHSERGHLREFPCSARAEVWGLAGKETGKSEQVRELVFSARLFLFMAHSAPLS